MTVDRLERLTNLVALLLEARRPVTQEQVTAQIEGYPPNKESARRQFERDKEALRAIGVPLRTVPVDGLGGELGYRIPPEEYELAPLDLTTAERAALHAAVSAVRLEEGTGRDALHKLGGAVGEGAPAIAQLPTLPVLGPLFAAARARSTIRFDHRGVRRTLDPYGLVLRRGHWYVVGHDHDRGEARSFRVDRIGPDVDAGPPAAFDVPEGLDPGALVGDDPLAFAEGEPVEVRLLVDAGRADEALAELGDDAVVERRPDGAVVVSLEVSNRPAFRSVVLGLLDAAEVLSPPEVRAEVVAWLEAVAGERA